MRFRITRHPQVDGQKKFTVIADEPMFASEANALVKTLTVISTITPELLIHLSQDLRVLDETIAMLLKSHPQESDVQELANFSQRYWPAAREIVVLAERVQ